MKVNVAHRSKRVGQIVFRADDERLRRMRAWPSSGCSCGRWGWSG